MPQILQVATTTATDLLAYAGRLFTDLKSILILLIGIPVGFFIIKRSISLITKRFKTKNKIQLSTDNDCRFCGKYPCSDHDGSRYE
jgi:hypothetical protein